MHPLPAQLEATLTPPTAPQGNSQRGRFVGNGPGKQSYFDYGQEGNQFSDVDSQLCVLDLWGWRFSAADPVGSFRLESSVKWCRKGESIMKKHLALSLWLGVGVALLLALGMMPAPIMAADATPIVGDWYGTLDPGAQPKKQMVVHIAIGQDGTLSGSIDYPDQDISGVQITAISWKGGALHFETSQGVYDGTSNRDSSEIAGAWKQGGAPLSLILKRTS
jgi:hypothetical protein